MWVTGGVSNVTNVTRSLPAASVARLPRYLRYLEQVAGAIDVVSSEDIADGSGVSAVQVRKDLSFLGASGTRGVGYHVRTLADQISRTLGLASQHGVAIVGAGNLGSALANYQGFGSRGFDMVGIYDVSPSAVGKKVGNLEVRHIDQMQTDAGELGITIGMIATPADAAADIARRMVEAGIRSILNFAPIEVTVPADITVRRVDLAMELQILSYPLAQS